MLTTEESLIHGKRMSCLDFKTILLKPSILSNNNNGDNGQPCLNPLELPKNVVAKPFTKSTKLAKVTQDRIQFDTSTGKPIQSRTNHKKFQFTLSWDFAESSFITMDLSFFYLGNMNAFLRNSNRILNLSIRKKPKLFP